MGEKEVFDKSRHISLFGSPLTQAEVEKQDGLAQTEVERTQAFSQTEPKETTDFSIQIDLVDIKYLKGCLLHKVCHSNTVTPSESQQFTSS